jgi:hypothetical protein
MIATDPKELKNNTTILYSWARLLLIMLLVIAVGIFIVNQTLAYSYKAQLLQSPCGLCVELNPEWAKCYEDNNRIIVSNTNYNKTNFNLTGLFINP